MAKNNFTLSKKHNPNYLATIQRVGELHPIEGSDNLLRAVIDGFDIVVPKTLKPEDIVVYVPVETAICEKYLASNNDYEINEWSRNANAAEVATLLAKGDEESKKLAKSKVGFFNKKGVVRTVKLRGVPSCGYVSSTDSLVTAFPQLKDTNWEALIGVQFDEICGERFCWKYIPPAPEEPKHGNGKHKKREKRLKRFDRMIPGQFEFHKDTLIINKNMHRFSPDDIVNISVKLHGTSGIFANILTKRKLSFKEKIQKFFGKNIPTQEYANIYASSGVIKNQYINPEVTSGYYDVDVWADVNKVFGPYIEKGMTVYGEIVGYVPGRETMIQKNHDYGCEVGKWKFMPYRITTITENGRKEWNVSDVDKWTHNLVAAHPELEEYTMFLTILYEGRFGDLYPDLDEHNHWQENVLERMKNDHTLFLMEELEPMCHLYEAEGKAAIAALEKAKADNADEKTIKKLQKEVDKWETLRAPREGVVIRVNDTFVDEPFKLKSQRHYDFAQKLHDAGVRDMEENESVKRKDAEA